MSADENIGTMPKPSVCGARPFSAGNSRTEISALRSVTRTSSPESESFTCSVNAVESNGIPSISAPPAPAGTKDTKCETPPTRTMPVAAFRASGEAEAPIQRESASAYGASSSAKTGRAAPSAPRSEPPANLPSAANSAASEKPPVSTHFAGSSRPPSAAAKASAAAWRTASARR